jgi:hypothetical protein
MPEGAARAAMHMSSTSPSDVRLEVITAVTTMNVVFWDIKTQFVLHRRHIKSPLQSSAS